MLEEELKNEEEVVIEEPAQANGQPRQEYGVVDGNKAALTVFILCCVALVICSIPIAGPIASIVLVLIAKGKLIDAEQAEKNPYKVFYRICKIAWWIILIFACLALIGWLVWLIVLIVGAIAAAAAEAGAAVAVLF